MNNGHGRGFTAVELLVAMGISIVITGVVFQFLFAGSKSYEKGSERLDLVQAYSAVIERLKRELREATYDIRVIGTEQLSFTKFKLDASSMEGEDATYLPTVVESTGFYELGEMITYEIKDSQRYKGKKRMVRYVDNNTKKSDTICSRMEAGDFKLKHIPVFKRHLGTMIKKNKKMAVVKIPSIRVSLKLKIGQKDTVIRTVIVPRFVSNWAKDPSWVTNHRGNALKLNY